MLALVVAAVAVLGGIMEAVIVLVVVVVSDGKGRVCSRGCIKQDTCH